MKRHVFLVSIAASASGCVGAWTGTDGGTTPLENPKAGFVYVGPVGDHGWSKTHDDGRLALEAELGIPTTYEPSVIPADAVTTMEAMIAEGSNIIFTTSFDFVSATQQVASTSPDARFLSCSGGVYAENLSSYMGRMYQPMYLAGVLAGQMTCTNRIGVVTSVPIPETVRHINAFTLGVREVNPDAVVEVKWVMNWFDPVVEPQLTDELIDHASDVIVTQTDTTIPLETAEGRTVTCNNGPAPTTTPVYTIGYDNPDSCTHAPESCLTSAYWNWGPMYIDLTSQIIDGTWVPSEIPWEAMKATPSESSVALSEFSEKVPGAVRLDVDSRVPDLVNAGDEHKPFQGPLRDNKGEVRVAAGDVMTDDELNRMCWFVEGVVSNTGEGDVPAVVPAGCGGDI